MKEVLLKSEEMVMGKSHTCPHCGFAQKFPQYARLGKAALRLECKNRYVRDVEPGFVTVEEIDGNIIVVGGDFQRAEGSHLIPITEEEWRKEAALPSDATKIMNRR